MNSNKNLVFLGMMGSGKSSIGNLVSKKLNLPFIDIDSLIVENAGMSVSEIFEKKGEDYFRNLEEKITLKCLKKINNVVSLGGGGFINDKIRKETVTNHLSFWLNWDESILFNKAITTITATKISATLIKRFLLLPVLVLFDNCIYSLIISN